LTDIFPLIGQQQKTGVLTLQEDKKGKRTVQFLFDKGMIVGTAFPSDPPDMPALAKRLIRGGILSAEKWKKAHAQQKEDLSGVENALLNTGMVVKEDLVAALRLLTFETFYDLFKWTGGIFRFETKEISYDPSFIEPISSEHLLLDVLRMVDEWPRIAERIPAFDMVLKKVDPTATLDDLTGTDWEKKRMVQMDVLYDLVDGQRTVQEIIDLSFVGEFDACKNLAVIMDAGMIEPVTVGTHTKKPKKIKAPSGFLRDAGAYLLVGLLAFFLALQMRVTRWEDFPFTQKEREKLQEIQAWKVERLKKMNARGVFSPGENRYSANPSEMAVKDLLSR